MQFDQIKVPKAPCEPDCPRRTMTCKLDCKKWEKYQIKQEAYRKVIYRRRLQQRAIDTYTILNREKGAKRGGYTK